jgi:phage terminase small subunit
MARGRIPKDTRFLVNPRRNKIAPIEDEVQPDGLGEAPEDFDDDEKAAWKAVSRSIPKGIVRGIDAVLLRRYCESIARLRRLKTAIAETLPSEKTFCSLVRLIQSEAMAQLKMESELCFSPSSRNRVTPTLEHDPELDGFNEFVAKRTKPKEDLDD